MFHNQHVSCKWHVFAILLIYVLPRASWVYLVWVHSQCGHKVLIIFPALRFGNLALNRMFLLKRQAWGFQT